MIGAVVIAHLAVHVVSTAWITNRVLRGTQ